MKAALKSFEDIGAIDVQLTQVRGRVTTATVIARFEVGPLKVVTGHGSSVCDDEDRPNPELGAQLALGRALSDLGGKLKRNAWARAR